MSGYSEENEMYLDDVKVLTKSSEPSRHVHFFLDDNLDEFSKGLRKALDCAEKLEDRGYIENYDRIDPVATYDLTEEGKKIVNEIENTLEEIDHLDESF